MEGRNWGGGAKWRGHDVIEISQVERNSVRRRNEAGPQQKQVNGQPERTAGAGQQTPGPEGRERGQEEG